MAYHIEFAPEVEWHLHSLTAAQRRLVLDGIEAQLSNQPLVQTRNRKPMRPNPLAAWELRIGDLRVYYTVEDDAVLIAAVGIKRREQIWIGGERIDL